MDNRRETSPRFDRDALASELTAGKEVDDFELLEPLGQSTRTVVFLARQQSMQRIVAVKIFGDADSAGHDVAQLEHPHIVRVYDQRRLRDGNRRLLYMQYLPGGTLEELLQGMQVRPDRSQNGAGLLELLDQRLQERGVEIPADSIQREQLANFTWPETVCFLGAQLSEALSYAHAGHVLHGNLKPSNVLFSENGVPKLVDFRGRAGLPSDYSSDSDSHNLVYCSPEQRQAMTGEYNDEGIDVRSDVYALGVILSEMLTRGVPCGDNAASATPRDEDRERGLPPDTLHGLRELLLTATSPSREERFASAGQMATQLRVCLDQDASRLFLPPEERLRKFAGLAPLTAMVMTLLVPNVLAGCFNYAYNYESIIKPLNADRVFQIVMATINAITYPGAVAIGVALVWSVCREVRRRFQCPCAEPANERVRRASLRVPHRLAMLGICAWCLAGIAYPVALGFAEIRLTRIDTFHFLGSLVLCGLMGATYPFFGAASIVVGVWYPALIRPGTPPPSDLADLRRLELLAPRYLILAGSVPLLGLAILSVWGRTDHRLLLGILSLGGFGLLFLMLHLWSQIGRALATLKNWAQLQ